MKNLKELPTTDSGHIKKADAKEWMNSLPQYEVEEVIESMKAKPTSHSGSLFPTETSSIRVTGDAEFIKKFAGLIQPIWENDVGGTRVEINLEKAEDSETGEITDNYALYLNVAERA